MLFRQYEDPTEALQRLRDRLDLRRGRDSEAFAEALRQRSEQLQKVTRRLKTFGGNKCANAKTASHSNK